MSQLLFRWRAPSLRVVLAALVLCATSTAWSQAYRLTPREVDWLTRFDGESISDVMKETGVSVAIGRVLTDVVGDAKLLPKTAMITSVRQVLDRSNHTIEREGRFIFVNRCPPHYCVIPGAAFIVDTENGQVAVAALTRDGKGTPVLLVARKACADAAFSDYAEKRLREWAIDGVRNWRLSPTRLAAQTVTTGCSADVAPPEAAARHPLEFPPRALTETELATLRASIGSGRTSDPMRTIYWSVHRIGGRGFHVASGTRPERISKRFIGKRGGSLSSIELDRYLLTDSCPSKDCTTGFKLAVDSQSGRLAFAVVHDFDAEGLAYSEAGLLTIFVEKCAPDDFKDWAQARLSTWADEVREWRADPGVTPEKATVVEASCG